MPPNKPWVLWENDKGDRFRCRMVAGVADELSFQPNGGRLPGQTWLPVNRFFSAREILLLGEDAKVQAQAQAEGR